MRPGKNRTTGNIGESDVSNQLTRFGWGVIPFPGGHDIGTDLIIELGDRRGFHDGQFFGVQVKGGRSWFDQKKRDASGKVIGWWYSERNRDHFDYWLGSALPHVLVLRDIKKRRSYWVHITHDAVKRAGKGARIFVPRHQMVRGKHRDQLAAVAASQRAPRVWQGSSWSGLSDLRPADLWRHAMLTPRLIAPHPNRGSRTALTPAQALAAVNSRRVWQFDRQQDEAALPSLGEMAGHRDWAWRFVAAMEARVADDDIAPLRTLVEQAGDLTDRTAAVVALACFYLEQARPEEAIDVLTAALAPDDAQPLDHAWMLTQLARAHTDLGRHRKARKLASHALRIRGTHPDDASATAIASGATSVLFAATSWRKGDLAATITGTDTVTTWWRAQSLSWGLGAALERSFYDWCRDTTSRSSRYDAALDPLISAMLVASHCGDAGAQRSAMGLVAREALMRTDRHSDPSLVAWALDALRLAGDEEDVKVAVRDRLRLDGPLTALVEVLAEVDLARSTRSTFMSDLALVHWAGDLMPALAAERAVRWMLHTLRDPRDYLRRHGSDRTIEYYLTQALTTVIPAAPATHQEVVEFVLALPPHPDNFLADPWARAVMRLPEVAWTPDNTARALQVADQHSPWLKYALIGACLPHQPAARQTLLADARAGSYEALWATRDVTHLPADVASVYVKKLASDVVTILEDARQGSSSHYEFDHGEVLSMLNVWHPQAADWAALVDLLSSPSLQVRYKRDAFRVLSVTSERIPEKWRSPIAGAARASLTVEQVQVRFFGWERTNVAGPALQLLQALDSQQIEDQWPRFMELTAGQRADRITAVELMTQHGGELSLGFLMAASGDGDPHIRAAAAAGIVQARLQGERGPRLDAVLERLAADTGRSVPLEMALMLAGREVEDPELARMLPVLAQHPSAAVRRSASRSAVPEVVDPA